MVLEYPLSSTAYSLVMPNHTSCLWPWSIAKFSGNGTELRDINLSHRCLSYLLGILSRCAHRRRERPSVTMLGIVICLPGANAGRFTKIAAAWGKAVQLMLFQVAWPGAAPVMFTRWVTSHSHQASTAYLLARINVGPTLPDTCAEWNAGSDSACIIGQRDQLGAKSRGVWSLVSGEQTRMDLGFRLDAV